MESYNGCKVIGSHWQEDYNLFSMLLGVKDSPIYLEKACIFLLLGSVGVAASRGGLQRVRMYTCSLNTAPQNCGTTDSNPAGSIRSEISRLS